MGKIRRTPLAPSRGCFPEPPQFGLPPDLHRHTPPPVCTKKRETYLEKTLDLRSHLTNRSRWRGERFWPATRRDAGRPQFSKRNSLTGQLTRGGLGKSILAAALTEEQRRGRPKDPPFLLRLRCTDFLIPIEIPVQNAAAGIYEMASKVNGCLTKLTDSLTDRTFKIARFYRGPNGLTAENKYIPPLALAPVRQSAAEAIPSPPLGERAG